MISQSQGPEVVELVPLQDEISRSTEVEELRIETLIDLLAEPTMEVTPSLAVMRP